MKKIFNLSIILILLVGMSCFGQGTRQRVENRSDNRSYYLKDSLNNCEYTIAYDETPFKYNDVIIKRNIYLYRRPLIIDKDYNSLNNRWEIVSDVIRTDYRTYEQLPSYEEDRGVKWYYESFCENKNLDINSNNIERNSIGFSKIELIDNKIYVKMLIFYGESITCPFDSKKEKNDNIYQHKWIIYVFIPTNNSKFTIIKQ
jgi:hypothetical protein